MNKRIRSWNYKDDPKWVIIKNFEKVKTCIFQILSGDGVLTIIYEGGKITVFDSDKNRTTDFYDGLWVFEPKDIRVLNKMKNHDDTDILDEAVLYE